MSQDRPYHGCTATAVIWEDGHALPGCIIGMDNMCVKQPAPPQHTVGDGAGVAEVRYCGHAVVGAIDGDHRSGAPAHPHGRDR